MVAVFANRILHRPIRGRLKAKTERAPIQWVRLLRSLAGFAASLLCLVFLWLGGELPGVGYREIIAPPVPQGGHAFQAALRDSGLSQDAPLPASLIEYPSEASLEGRSACRVLPLLVTLRLRGLCGEWRRSDARASDLVDIREKGGGRFLIWRGQLIFSTLDGADARGNGRVYVLWIPNTAAAGGLYLLAALVLTLTLVGTPQRRSARAAVAVLGMVAAFVSLAAARGQFNTNAAVGLALGVALVAATRLMALPARWRLARAAAFALLGFLAAHAILGAVAARWRLVGDYPLYAFYRHAAQKAAQARHPVILFVGSSLSENGLQEDVMEQQFRAAGHDVTVIRLVAGGMSVFEQWHSLREFLRLTNVRPHHVFLEYSFVFHFDALWPVKNFRFTSRIIPLMDFETALWSLRWAAGSDLPLRSKAGLVADVLGQLFVNQTALGFVWKGQVFDRVLASPSAPITAPRPPLSDDRIAHMINHAFDPAAAETVPDTNRAWIGALLERQIEQVRKLGTANIGFYAMPIAYPTEIAYSRAFCGAMASRPCIGIADPDLFQRLKAGRMWSDETHVGQEGRLVVSRWIVERILAKIPLP